MVARPVTDDDLRALPKAHLHLHLTGGMRHETLVELASEHGIRLPERLADDDPDDWRALGWARFQRLYDVARSVLRRPSDVARVAREIAEDECAAGSRWLELQVTPTGYVGIYGDVVTATEALCEAVQDAGREVGVPVRVVIAANRARPPWEAELLARIAVRHAHGGVVGFGLSNDERLGAPEEFAKAFRLARDAGLMATPHAGELLGAESVRRTLDALQPRRIGHGVRAVEDDSVLRRLADEGVACEVCPASNVALGLFSGHEQVPLRALQRIGVPVVLAADDPLLFGAGLVEQYAAARDAHGYSAEELAALARASFTHSSMPAEECAAATAAVDDWRDLFL